MSWASERNAAGINLKYNLQFDVSLCSICSEHTFRFIFPPWAHTCSIYFIISVSQCSRKTCFVSGVNDELLYHQSQTLRNDKSKYWIGSRTPMKIHLLAADTVFEICKFQYIFFWTCSRKRRGLNLWTQQLSILPFLPDFLPKFPQSEEGCVGGTRPWCFDILGMLRTKIHTENKSTHYLGRFSQDSQSLTNLETRFFFF